jgi:hypothetical protein
VAALMSFSALAVTPEWESYLADKKAIVSHERHLPILLYHGHKTAKSVLLIHGIYSSPFYFRGMAYAFYEAGFNVVSLLLPGHWEKDLRSVDRLTGDEWEKDADRGWEIARSLGDRVILAGHSLGGLMSIVQSHKRPFEQQAGIFLVSPAVQMWGAVVAACYAGDRLRISGNVFTGDEPDGDQVPYFGPSAGILIDRLGKKARVRDLPVPTYMAYTRRDNVLDVPGLSRYFERQKGAKKGRVYPLRGRVHHANIGQGPRDVGTYKESFHNPYFDHMMAEGIEFLQKAGGPL